MAMQNISVLALTVALTGTVSACRFLTPAGVLAGAGDNSLGVVRSAGDSGNNVAVDVLGTAVIEAGAAISAGDTLKADGTGRGIPWATSGAKVALALEAAGAAGEFVEVLLIPNVA